MKTLADYPDAHLRRFDRPALPPPEAVEDVYLIGICGTGMGALAGLMRAAGYHVRGSDAAAYPPMSVRLAAMGIPVHEGYDAAHLDPPPDLVVVGNACTPTHAEAAYAREQRLVQCSLPEAVAHFFLADRTPLVVAGTHGKTTTTGLLVHVLQHAGVDPGFLVGGVMIGTEAGYAVGRGAPFVLEGDEYDSAYFDKRPKFMHYRPRRAVVTSVEFDHADIYAGWDDYRAAFERFAAHVPANGLLALNADDPAARALAAHTEAHVRRFGLCAGAEVTAKRVEATPDGQEFTLMIDGAEAAAVQLPMSGAHNLRNALAAATLALAEGLAPQQVAAGLSTFRGMKRRQEVRGEAGGVLVIDDFAHHPTAVQQTTRAVKQRWPERRVVAVFEPRSNSSRRKVFEAAYAEAFVAAGHVFLSAPPLRHNDAAGDMMDAEAVVRRIGARGTAAALYPSADALLGPLADALRPGDVALVMSNGGFGNLHVRLLDALAARAGASSGVE